MTKPPLNAAIIPVTALQQNCTLLWCTATMRGAFVDPGGDIMIHGQPNQVAEGYKVKGDWTDGCIALTNLEIAELFAHARIGTEVEIRP